MSDTSKPFAFSQFVPGFDFLRNLASGSASGNARIRRPEGLRMRIAPSRPATSRPEVRLEMISPLSRSEASARAAVARSCAFSRSTASCSAADSTVASIEPSLRIERRVSWAAARKRSRAKVTTAAIAPTIAVRRSSE